VLCGEPCQNIIPISGPFPSAYVSGDDELESGTLLTEAINEVLAEDEPLPVSARPLNWKMALCHFDITQALKWLAKKAKKRAENLALNNGYMSFLNRAERN